MPNNVLPPSWTVVTGTEHVPAPVEPGIFQYPPFARQTTRVLNSAGQLVAASGDRDDAINQALAVCQATDQPYDSAAWNHA